MQKLKHIFTSFILIIITTLIVKTPVFAEWTKSANNPVLSPGFDGEWDDSFVFQPNVLYDGNEYRMWYSGSNETNFQIGLATSSSEINWIKNASNPVLNKLSVGKDAHDPNIVNDNGIFKMWYATSLNGGLNDFKIHYAFSFDGINWIDGSDSPVLIPTESWETDGISDPHVLKINDLYHMWYLGSNNGVWQTGYATSSDGINWIKYPGNPVAPNGTGSVLYDGFTYTRYYHIDSPSSIHKATSPDGINWTDSADNPILTTGTNGDFDDFRVAGPHVIKVGNTLKMWYAGHDGSTGWKIGLAEEILPGVPYFSQADPIWGSDKYDHLSATMEEVGCAITAVAMALKYKGVLFTPGNPDTGLTPKELTPGTLNEWMISRNDSTFRNGETNWALIAIMTHLRNNIDPNSPKLEYSYSNDPAMLDVLMDPAVDLPGIVEASHPDSPSGLHFVVATEKQGSNYKIHDPFHTDRTTLNPYYPNINRVGWYTPTESNFSYLILAVNPEVTVTLRDENGNEVGDTFIQKPIANDVTGTINQEPLKMLMLPKPPSGTYTFTVTSNTTQNYQLDTYIYDSDGNVNLQTNTDSVNQLDTDSYTVIIDALSSNNSSITQLCEEVTFYSLAENIKSAYQLKWIQKGNVYRMLLRLATRAKRYYERGYTRVGKRLLNTLLGQLNMLNGKLITQDAYDLLKSNTQTLLDSL